ncbi:MAG: hypothetical protein GTO41_09675, partial [Burkholderiales bacterium]|nr:hypothetical protein [Burkholderiales bacterium]
MPTNQWVHLVWRRPGDPDNASTNNTLYVNGEEVSLSAAGLSDDTSTPNVSAGVFQMFGDGSSGDMDNAMFDTRIYTRALSEAECRSLYAPATR